MFEIHLEIMEHSGGKQRIKNVAFCSGREKGRSRVLASLASSDADGVYSAAG